jgi:ketosteroid isomerase-like protein
MIGAIIAKKRGSSSFDAVNRRDLAKHLVSTAEEATLIFPGNTPISGEMKGKKAIEAFYTRMMEQFTKMHFKVNEVFVSDIFAMGPTNKIAVEWDSTVTNREGKEFRNSGVTIAMIKGGKVVAARDYVFDIQTLNESWEKV